MTHAPPPPPAEPPKPANPEPTGAPVDPERHHRPPQPDGEKPGHPGQ